MLKFYNVLIIRIQFDTKFGISDLKNIGKVTKQVQIGQKTKKLE